MVVSTNVVGPETESCSSILENLYPSRQVRSRNRMFEPEHNAMVTCRTLLFARGCSLDVPVSLPFCLTHTLFVSCGEEWVGTNVGLAFVVIAVGVGVAAAGVGVAGAVLSRSGSEVFAYGGWYFRRKHRIPLWYLNGRLWCPLPMDSRTRCTGVSTVSLIAPSHSAIPCSRPDAACR